MTLGLIKLIAGLVGVTGFVIGLSFAVRHEIGVHRNARALGECVALAKGPRPGPTQCPLPLVTAVATANTSTVCDAQLDELARRSATGVPVICSRPVRAVAAAREAAAATIVSQAAALTAARTDQQQAIARATARAVSTTERKANAQAVLAAAPRDGAGRSVCDARCLRELAGDVTGPAR